jgi:exosome complex RNA-binding protein Rrp42 (RNase PH superfamily)
MLQSHSRADGRLLAQFRDTTIQQGILSKHAAGSALISFRNDDSQDESTSILAAVTLQVGQPRCTAEFPAGRGDIDVTVSSFKEDDSINISVLQSYLQRTLDVCIEGAQDDMISTDEDKLYHPLLLVPAKAAIGLVVTVKILQNAGNVGDAALLACIAALMDTRIPCREHGISLDEKTGRIWWQPKGYDAERKKEGNTATGCRCSERGETQHKMRFPLLPLPVTIGSYCNETSEVDDRRRNWLIDPSSAEECSMSTMITVVVNGHAPEQILLLDFCPSSGENNKFYSLRTKDLILVAQIAKARAEELKRILVA